MFPAMKGVCDTPLHMFDHNIRINELFLIFCFGDVHLILTEKL